MGTHEIGLLAIPVTAAFQYDVVGNLIAESRPHEEGDESQGVITHTYDAWFARVATTFPDDTSIEYYYANRDTYLGGTGFPASSEFFNHNGAVFASLSTKRGPSGSALQFAGGQVVDSMGLPQVLVDAAGTYTDYFYGDFHVLDTIVHVRGDDSVSNETTFDYDHLGRLLLQDDPDAGVQIYTYDAFDEVFSLRAANEVASFFGYDAAGRLIQRDDEELDTGTRHTTRWEYGLSAVNNNIGRVVRSESPDGIVTEYDYYPDGDLESRGLPFGQTKTVPRSPGSTEVEQFSTRMIYDSFKRLETLVYPEAAGESFSVRFGRDAVGNVTSVYDGADTSLVYWRADVAYQGRAVKEAVLANGIRQKSFFDPTNGRISGLVSTLEGDGDLVQDLAYLYYPDGLLQTRWDRALSFDDETFYYDALDRLKQSVKPINEQVSTIENYDYDARGNLIEHNSTPLTYDHPGGVMPHAVRTMGTNEYSYNSRGSQTLRVGPNVAGGRQEIQYTPFNLPRRIDMGPEGAAEVTLFGYDAGNARTYKRNDDRSTVSIDGLYERVEDLNSSGSFKHKYHVFADGHRVVQVSRNEQNGTLDAPEYLYLLRDRLGSVHTITNEDGAVVHVQEFKPFGTDEQPAFDTTGVRTGFTGHEHDDELGLIDMGGRMYDPALRRFLTADPLANPLSLQSLNRYSYVLNSPMNLVDPTGFSIALPLCEGACGYSGSGGSGGPDSVDVGGAPDAPRGLAGSGQEGPVNPVDPRDAAPALSEQAAGSSQTSQPVERPYEQRTEHHGTAQRGRDQQAVYEASQEYGGGRRATYAPQTEGPRGPGSARTGSGSVPQVLLTAGTPAGAGAVTLRRDMPSSPGDLIALSSMIPGVGEALDLYDFVFSEDPDVQKIAAVSLLIGAAVPELPNAGGIRRAARGAPQASRAIVPYFPANAGFAGAVTRTTLKPGTVIDRFGGSAFSRFFSPAGTAAGARSLPPDVAGQALRSFQVVKPLPVDAGRVAPAFGQLGGGTQFRSSLTLQEALQQGFLREIF